MTSFTDRSCTDRGEHEDNSEDEGDGNRSGDDCGWDLETDDEMVEEDLTTRTILERTVTLESGPITSLLCANHLSPESTPATHQSSYNAIDIHCSHQCHSGAIKHHALEDRMNELTRQNAALQDRLEKAEIHCQMAVMEVENLHKKLSSRISRSKGKGCTMVTDSRCFTSSEGLITLRAQEAERQAKLNKKDELNARRHAAEASQAARRQEQSETMIFSGSPLSKNKPNLQDIMAALQLSTDGTKAFSWPAVRSTACPSQTRISRPSGVNESIRAHQHSQQ
ncbi:hypothetical protein WOLCODRAFT_20779 [Wolfiporia cocos MD-104 SS10]|uniref:Uncharacterized protein n=1 Tax=Wolfiporia cocos (strain MD-104) TaxID=742152 RepID=A0A2H3J3P7_WOLCO|nr:hypothetical protein WOLCODRAFT_20779 [Wolfiporia cocos MD-104 SS10]